jgi:hypothetical protein
MEHQQRIEPRQEHVPRAGWAEQFAEMAEHGDDALLDGDQPMASSWDATEWVWQESVNR